MEFLDSLDLDLPNKRSRRVRSWYLYEQFKSLERNQLDAAQKLKDRSYQDRILRQELSERKARRKLYDQFGLCHSESRIERSVKSEGTKSVLSGSCDDFFESFCELQDLCLNTTNVSQVSCHDSKHYEDDFKSVTDKDDTSYVESVNSVVNVQSEETITEDIQQNIDKEHTVVGELNQCFDEVKDNLDLIEKLTELDVDDKMMQIDSLYSIEEKEVPVPVMKDKTVSACENNAFAMWSRLVSFAYQIIQLNHGNCYVDYGYQFLTAVLACDVLRCGINKMCHILQPYVSPIKFVTDDSESSTDSYKNVKRKPRQNRSRCTCTDMFQTNFTKKYNPSIPRKYRSENSWQRSGHSNDNRTNEKKERWASEPWRSIPLFSIGRRESSALSKSLYSTEWPDFSNDDSTEYFLKEGCKRRQKMLNPMLKLSQYFDSVLKEIDDSILV